MFKYATGPMMNLFGRGAGYGSAATGASVSTGASASFPLANLYDGRPSVPMALASMSNGFYFRFPNNLVQDGDMEQSGTSNWTLSGLSSGVKNNTIAYKGTWGMVLEASAIDGGIYQDVTVQSGMYLRAMGALRPVSGGGYMQLSVLNLNTQKWLSPAGAWQSARTHWHQHGSPSYSAATLDFRVETIAQCGGPTAKLRVWASFTSATGTGYVDEVFLVPGLNFVSVHGHGIQYSGVMTTETTGSNYWHSPTSAAGGIPNATFTRQSFYSLASSMWYEPYPTIVVVPTGSWGGGTLPASGTQYIGELVCGQATDFPKNPNFPVALTQIEPISRQASPAGEVYTYRTGGHPIRELRMPFTFKNATQYDTFRTEFYDMSRGGQYPMIIIPTETHPNEVLYGRIKETSVTFTRDNNVERKAEFSLIESPLPFME